MYKRQILSSTIGGLSGKAIKPQALRCVYDIYQSINIPIIGCGGISSWQDAVEFFLAGAEAVQVGTAVFQRDLEVFNEINEGLKRYLTRKKIPSIKKMVGTAHRSPNAYQATIIG